MEKRPTVFTKRELRFICLHLLKGSGKNQESSTRRGAGLPSPLREPPKSPVVPPKKRGMRAAPVTRGGKQLGISVDQDPAITRRPWPAEKENGWPADRWIAFGLVFFFVACLSRAAPLYVYQINVKSTFFIPLSPVSEGKPLDRFTPGIHTYSHLLLFPFITSVWCSE